MIIYRELSSLQSDLGCSLKQLYTLSNNINQYYHRAKIPKGNGEFRELNVPDEQLKSVQRKIANIILPIMEISPYATAYRVGGTPLANANPHVGCNLLLKLDIRHFFDKITFATVMNKAFPDDIFSKDIQVLLCALCCYRDSLPQGAPTSPAISNLVMTEFDNTVGNWCKSNHIIYTRYCDDMTFSGDFEPKTVIEFVKNELFKMGFFLNEKKTTVVKKGQKKIVTGIVVNEKANASAVYRKTLRQTLYYCMKYGVESQMEHKNIKESKQLYLQKLLGKVNFVLSVTPKNDEFKTYKEFLMNEING